MPKRLIVLVSALIITVVLTGCSSATSQRSANTQPTGRASLPWYFVRTEDEGHAIVVDWNNEVSACVVDPAVASAHETKRTIAIRVFERAFILKGDEACGGVGEAGILRVALHSPIDGRTITGASPPVPHQLARHVPGVIGLSPRQAVMELHDIGLHAALPVTSGKEIVAQTPGAGARSRRDHRVELTTGR